MRSPASRCLRLIRALGVRACAPRPRPAPPATVLDLEGKNPFTMILAVFVFTLSNSHSANCTKECRWRNARAHRARAHALTHTHLEELCFVTQKFGSELATRTVLVHTSLFALQLHRTRVADEPDGLEEDVWQQYR